MPLRQPRLPRHDAGAQALTPSGRIRRCLSLFHADAERRMLPWAADVLERQLAPCLGGIRVQAVGECGSTNSELVERARADADADGDAFTPCLLVAERQTAGRGRLGRGWVAAPGASLTFSLALPLEPADWSGLSLAVGVALADALEPVPMSPSKAEHAGEPRTRIGLKWPNDLWLREADGAGGDETGRKLGGILVETVGRGAAGGMGGAGGVGRAGGSRVAVVGIGLNISPLPAEAAAGLGRGIASLREIDPAAGAPSVLHRVAAPLVQALHRFEREGFAPLVARYARRDVLRGREVSATGAQAPATGAERSVAEGVDADGALWLRAGAVRQRIVSGEVSVTVASQVAR